MKSAWLFAAVSLIGGAISTTPALAEHDNNRGGPSACAGLPTHAQLKAALQAVVTPADSGGFKLQMWGTVVNRDGVVCAVAFTGANRGSQWPGSRVISAQKANTANAFSLPGYALSTANLYSATQPGGSLYGLQHSNPVDPDVAYGGNPGNYGQPNDPMVGGRIGGVNVFGGGLGLYNSAKQLIGGVGVSGDTSCTDHNVAWKTRKALVLDFVPGGPNTDATKPDNLIPDITLNPDGGTGKSASGWGHPECALFVSPTGLPAVRP